MNIKTLALNCTFCFMFAIEGKQTMPKKKEALAGYRRKRDLAVSPEPKGSSLTKRIRRSKKPLFVIQKHQASHLHYDLRLQIGQVLVSWAVPKGPSMSTRVRRLAINTEDHPLDYAYFEGVIPSGYGAGTVMVWDLGDYENLKPDSMKKCYEKGQIEVRLVGEKLQGNFALIRTGYLREGGDRNWLLIKMKDEKDATKKKATIALSKSALSGKTMAQIKRSAKDDA